MANSNAHYIFYGYQGASTVVLRVELRYSSGSYQVNVSALDDGTTWKTTGNFNITDAPHLIEFDWLASTSSGANNGTLTYWIDGVQKALITGIDSDTRRIDSMRFGPVSGLDTGTRGTYFMDEVESQR